MKKIIFSFFLILIVIINTKCSKDNAVTNNGNTLSTRNGLFFHHSSGLNIWGPNGSNTSVTQEITAFNNSHSLTGSNAFSLEETWFPDNPNDNNEWERWHRIFDNQDPNAPITNYFSSHKILIIKSCFPSSEMSGTGQPSDTITPAEKTIYNYKWHWRHIINVMKTHNNNFFVIWTNAPLVAAATDSIQAQLANQFCKWAKDTLARGLDPSFGTFPTNVYVFDYFHKLAGSNGIMQSMYAVDINDSHPNSAATQLVAPQFVNETCTAFLNADK
jgi:hypothetical protein